MKYLKKFNENIEESPIVNNEQVEQVNEGIMEIFQIISDFLSNIDATQSIEIASGKTMSSKEFFLGVLGGIGVLGTAAVASFPDECKEFGQKLLKTAGSIPKAVMKLIDYIKNGGKE
jgi:hypothetical protein